MARKTISVKELSLKIKEKFDKTFSGYINVIGEVTNLTDKKHVWFNMKDQNTDYTIGCVMWEGTKRQNDYQFDNGDIIVASGKLQGYDKNNSYKMIVSKLKTEKTAESEYKLNYKKYEKHGYFNKNNVVNKEDIKNIGLITSYQGEAIQDFKKTISNRFFHGNHIFTCNVNVQGENCVNSIISAIDSFEKSKVKIDVLLITRGGGSKLDLDGFNDPDLVERIYDCDIPVYCAIGHEKDYTLCDYVCDLRSSTPTSLALEVSDDKQILKNKMIECFNDEKYNFNNLLNKQKIQYIKVRNTIENKLYNNKPSGFNFKNNRVNKLNDFEKLSKEKFVIKLEDCEIEVKLSDYKILKKYDSRFLFSEYQKLLTTSKDMKKYSLDNLLENEQKYTFGTEKHFKCYKQIIECINYYENENKKIINDTESICNYSADEVSSLKKHINFLEETIKNLNNLDVEETKITLEEFMSITKIDENTFSCFKYLDNKLPKYKKMKQKN